MSTTEPKEGEWWERGRPCTLADCPIGLFEYQGELCLKTEYGTNDGRIDAYIVSSGEFFWGGGGIAGQRKVMVTPVQVRIPDPPAPEPTEAEKIDARRARVLSLLPTATPYAEQTRAIRASDEAAGYVTVRTEGPMFDEMTKVAMRHAHPILGEFCESRLMGLRSLVRPILRAALSAAKGEGR